MPFVDTNSHLMTKPFYFDIMCHSNSESYDRDGIFKTNFKGGQNLLFTVGGFSMRESTMRVNGWSFSYA